MSFGTMLLAAWTALLVYAAARTARIPAVARRVRARTWLLAAAALWALFPLGRALRGTGAALVGSAAMHLLAVLFLVAAALALVDAVTAFGLFSPRLAPRLRGWAVLGGLAMAAVALVQGHRAPVVATHEVRLPGLPAELDGTTVVALSDLHLGESAGEPWLGERVDQVAALRPDLVVLVGDVLEGRGAGSARFVPGLARIPARLGKYAVTGNHENHGGEGTATAAFAAAGFEVLRDRWALAAPGLVIAGVDDRRGRRPGAAPLEQATAARPEGALLFLSHSPGAAAQAAEAGVGLMLSGHTHGGQVWPFGLVVRLAYPYVAGRFRVGGMTLIVGRGAGSWGPRMRLWRPGEILRVVLRAPRAAAGGGSPPVARDAAGSIL